MRRLKNIDVLILAGGLGKRLRKISRGRPKPMVRFQDTPFLDILIRHMVNFGFKRFILGIGYKANVVKAYYASRKIKGLEILFSQERKPLGTGGAVKKAKRLLKSNPFIVLNGDSFCKFKPLDFLKFHKKKKAVVSILLKEVENGADYGKVKLDKANRIVDFNEKNSQPKSCLINVGVYVFDKKAFGLMPRAKVFSLERDFFPKLAGKNCFGYAKSKFFIDIGTPERYLKANRYFLKNTYGRS
jgi:NDP-sugar pyrophosphorylase family protein